MHFATPCQRRQFLRRVGASSVAAASAGTLLKPRLFAGDEPPAKDPVDVGIAHGSSMEDAVREAVKMAGGLEFIKPDQTVLIKPNVTGGAMFPTTTNPEVLYAVIKLVSERGPKRIIVADRCFSPVFDVRFPKTIDIMKRVGHVGAVEQAASELKAPVVAVGLEDCAAEFERLGKPANTEHWRKVKPERAEHWPNGYELAELLFAVDHVINVPVIKTHFQAWFTMSMKAFVGMSHHRTRQEFHNSFSGGNDLMDQKKSGSRRRRGEEGRKLDVAEAEPLVNRIAELNLGITPAMNILDGSKSFVFGGPSHGDTVEPKLVVASKDRIAADATGVAVLKHFGTEYRLQRYSVWENPFIRHAIKIGVGIDGVDKIKLHQSGLDSEIESIQEMLA